ncbi:MAG: MFS transporter [Bacteroidetes bacterium]|nr:MFS transporter [Bacteroidota bacterium]
MFRLFTTNKFIYLCVNCTQVLSSTVVIPAHHSKLQVRLAVSMFFFCQGVCFASWASRIPDIKSALHLSEAALGTILLGLPIGQLVTMPFSGRAVTRFGSKNILRFAIIGYALTLTCIGLVKAPWQLAVCLFIFGVFGNMCNISVNTQGVNAEALFSRPIMASFHGVWSSAGVTGALTGLGMVNWHVIPYIHFCIVAAFVILLSFIFVPYLLHTPVSKSATSFKGFQKPAGLLLQLGIIGFCCLSCEGCMFDWSGVYFKQVVKVNGPLVTLGYVFFMATMATGRFLSHKLGEHFSRRKLVQVSGVTIFSGMLIAVALPYLVSASIGFLMVGLGVSTIVPMLYSTVGKADLKVSKGMAIATVSSIGFLGFVLGPPFIGYVAQAAGLQYSFMTIAFLGLGVSFLVSRVKEIQ